MSQAYKGKFVPENKEKYRGDYSKITYRSSWELFIMKMLDRNTEVKWWGSEITVIPYFSESDGKKRRYFIDMTICWKDGNISLWEVKPAAETRPPAIPSRNTAAAKKRFADQVYTWGVNTSKWKATIDVCQKKGWKFNIITEDVLKRMGFKGVKDDI
ncbi:head completion protein [Aeromonas phage AsFcp_4]|uniref:Head completion nuclease n=1 Tax=Aeromonas phage PX29 TaxID=926067 RepID=E5DQB9_9CAUD|nr:head closure [Aeromonas phage PX29]ADQ52905.1 gp4 head completion protein [Aeromonas phage PX29]QAX98448.1 head completion protein [Aeromonas phage AsFcp_2]QAX99480.1 head completion protein [Aeromonas phage AsFcp_4]